MTAADDPRALFEAAVQQQQLGHFRDAEALYRRVLVLNPRVLPAHNNLGIILRETGRYRDAVEVLEQAVAQRPGYTAAINNLGLALKSMEQYARAADCFRRVLALQPDHAEGLSNLGATLWVDGKFSEAIACYERALSLKPNFVEALTGLGNALEYSGRMEEAVALYKRALAIDPDNVETLCNFGILTEALGDFDGAIQYYQRAIAVSPDYDRAFLCLSMAALLRGDYATGMRALEWELRKPEIFDPWREFKEPIWDGKTDGVRILVHAVHGLGDTLQFCRYAPMVAARGNRVTLEVQKPLARLMSRIEGVDAVIGRGDPLPEFDFHCPTLDAPGLFHTGLETIPASVPYLKVEPEKQDAWRKVLPAAPLHIGVAWSGNARNDRNRPIPLATLAPLIRDSGAHWHVLHTEFRAGDEELMRTLPSLAYYPEPRDFSDTAALASVMDLVISIDTSILHLAGALALPTWGLIPMVPSWRWMLNRSDTPWYPTMRLFRQPKFGDWDSVVAAVAEALRGIPRRAA